MIVRSNLQGTAIIDVGIIWIASRLIQECREIEGVATLDLALEGFSSGRQWWQPLLSQRQ